MEKKKPVERRPDFVPPTERDVKKMGALESLVFFGRELKRIGDQLARLSAKDNRLSDSLEQFRNDVDVLLENYQNNGNNTVSELNAVLTDLSAFREQSTRILEQEDEGFHKIDRAIKNLN